MSGGVFKRKPSEGDIPGNRKVKSVVTRIELNHEWTIEQLSPKPEKNIKRW